MSEYVLRPDLASSPIYREITPEREGELFSRMDAFGFGFYSPAISERFQDSLERSAAEAEVRGEDVQYRNPRLWLEREAHRAFACLTTEQSLVLSGDLGSGKGAVLYGMRQIHREAGIPYVLVDGHYHPTADRVRSALYWAQKNDARVFWDSIDYLAIKKNTGNPDRRSRVDDVLTALDDFLTGQAVRPLHRMYNHAEGHKTYRGNSKYPPGSLVATIHTQPWLNRNTRPMIRDDLFQTISGLPEMRIYGMLESMDERFDFARQRGMSLKEAEVIARLADRIGDFLGHPSNPEHMVISESLKQYRVLKLMTHPKDLYAGKVMAYVKGELDETEFINATIERVTEINRKDSQKQQVPGGYSFLPAAA